MKKLIKEKRRLPFTNRRISPKTIRSLSKIIDKEIASLNQKEEETAHIIFSLDANDDTSYESQSSDIFGHDKIIEFKIIRKIVMNFNTLNHSKNIEIQIVNSQKNDKSENFILVSGDDENWVRGVLTSLSEVIHSAEEQPRNTKLLGYFMFFSWLIFLIEYIRVIGSPIEHIPYVFIRLMVGLGIPIASIIAWFLLYDYLSSLFPSIELQTGADYQQIPAKKRKLAFFWISVIIIPIAIEITLDIFKSIRL